MARTRLELHEELCEVLGSRKCYFSPPSTLEFPCILYKRERPLVNHADNIKYRSMNRWTITIIDENPDSDIPRRLEEHFQHYCTKDREYPSDGLNHFVYDLYY